MRDVIQSLIELVYPKRCVVCKAGIAHTQNIDDLICMACWGSIKRNVPPFCCRCGRHLKKDSMQKNICAACVKNTLHFDRAFAPCVYEGTTKELIRELKYRGKDYLGTTLGGIMADFIKAFNVPIAYLDMIIPVPLHPSKLREREFNQAQVLGARVAREFHMSVSGGVLIRHRPTRTQTELAPQERLTNMQNAFLVTDRTAVKGKNILLVDDVLTTGATCSEAAYALKNAGAHIVFALTLAH
jgi:ComF family protein